jgi:hypothetical protein
MSIFNYILPSGAEFTVRGPSGATQAEADKIFYEQVAAGALVGYESGQTLTSPASRITKFELSRLDRGTAGVDTNVILAIIQGLPQTASGFLTQSVLTDPFQDTGTQLTTLPPASEITAQNQFPPNFATQTIVSAIQSLPVPIGVPNLSDVLLTNPIDEADIALIRGDDLAPNAISANAVTALTEYQVQKLLAQVAVLVDQESDQVSLQKGLGRYGFTAYSLEQAGYVKPGTSAKFFESDPSSFVSVMRSPSVWTGKAGVYSSTDLLDDPVIQNRIQVQLMQQGYDELVANGTINTIPQPSISVSTGQVFTNTGLQSVATLSRLSLLGTNLGSLNGVAQNALTQSTVLNTLLQGTNVNLSTIGSGAVNNLVGGLSGSSFSGVASSLTNRITGSVGSLIVNASKFGGDATALWAKSGTLGSLTGATTQLSNLGIGSLQNQIGSISGALTGQLGSLTGNINNITKI